MSENFFQKNTIPNLISIRQIKNIFHLHSVKFFLDME
jgi:hypothetical protein